MSFQVGWIFEVMIWIGSEDIQQYVRLKKTGKGLTNFVCSKAPGSVIVRRWGFEKRILFDENIQSKAYIHEQYPYIN